MLEEVSTKMVTGKYLDRLEKMNQQGFVDQFHQRVIKRFERDFQEPILDIQFVYTQKYRTLDEMVGFYMILLLKQNSLELIDISGQTCATHKTDGRNYTQIMGNPHNDEHYFTAMDEDGSIDSFHFTVRPMGPRG